MRCLLFFLLIPFCLFSQNNYKKIPVTELSYIKITELSNNVYNVPKSWNNIDSLIVKKIDSKLIYHFNDEVIGEMNGSELTLFLEENVQIKIDDNFCFVDGIPCIIYNKILTYDFALDFITMSYCCVSELPYLQYYVSRKTGLIDYNNGKIVTDTSDIEINGFRNGLADFKKDKKWGFVNNKFEIVIPPVFTTVLNFNDNGLARASNEQHSGFINQKGEWVYKFDKSIMTYHMPFYEDYAVVKSNSGKFGFINRKGKLKVDTIYNRLSNYFDGYAIAMKNLTWGFLKKRKWIPLPDYEEIKYGANNLFLAKKNGKWGIIDVKNKIVIPFVFDELSADHSFLYFKKQNKWGVMNYSFKTIIEPQYEQIQGYGYDLFTVKKNRKWGFVNINNEVIIPFIFDSALIFTPYGRSIVGVNAKYELIDSQGHFLSTKGWIEFQKMENKNTIGKILKMNEK